VDLTVLQIISKCTIYFTIVLFGLKYDLDILTGLMIFNRYIMNTAIWHREVKILSVVLCVCQRTPFKSLSNES